MIFSSGGWRYLILSTTAVLTLSEPAQAGSAALGSITDLRPHSSGMFFMQTGVRNAAPSCATVTQRWAIDVSTPQGQAMAAALLTAYIARKRITILGTDTCSVWANTETIDHFTLED